MYLNYITQSDIAFSFSRLSKFSAKLSKKHMKFAIHTLQYLQEIKTFSILYNKISNIWDSLTSYSDASFADNLNN